MLIQCQELSKTYGSSPLFSNLSLVIDKGDKFGLLGANGSGKSTLLNILRQELSPDEGKVIKSRNLRIGFSSQDSHFHSEDSILTAAEKVAKKIGIAPHSIPTETSIALSLAGFSDFDQTIATLSGGWKKRLTIACATMGEPNILFLDEPTNHLDWDGILWLESFLKNKVPSWVMISHDRYLTNQTVNKILDIDSLYENKYRIYDSNYNKFVDQKNKFKIELSKQHESLKNKLRREDAWLNSGVKARTTKSKYRSDEAVKLKEIVNQSKQRLSNEDSQIEFDFSQRKTKKLIEIKNLSFSFENKQIISKLDLTISSQKRIGILGDNGVGKSCFFKLLNEELRPSEGSIIKAPELKIVYFDQSREGLKESNLLKTELCEHGDYVTYKNSSLHIASWGKKFGFTAEHLSKPVSKLSGGQRAKVLIAKLMLKKADILLLDEPTNDLDTNTIEILEEALLNFEGSILIISHDRYLLEKMCHTFLGFSQSRKNLLQYASPSQWIAEKEPSHEKKTTKKTSLPDKNEIKSPKKLSYNEQHELKNIEAKIIEAEEKMSNLENDLENAQQSYTSQQIEPIYLEFDKVTKEVENLYKRWNELEEKKKSFEKI